MNGGRPSRRRLLECWPCPASGFVGVCILFEKIHGALYLILAYFSVSVLFFNITNMAIILTGLLR